MEILFKDDYHVYYIEDDELDYKLNEYFSGHDLSNIRHLDDMEILYHYIDIDSKFRYPVYYEHRGRVISNVNNKYVMLKFREEYIKDYTLVNLKLV